MPSSKITKESFGKCWSVSEYYHSNKSCRQWKPRPAPNCRVLPPSKCNSMIPTQLPVYPDRFTTIVATVAANCCNGIKLITIWVGAVPFLPRDAMHKRGICHHPVSVRPSVRPSRSWVALKRIKISSKFFSPSGSQAILVFECQTGCRYSDGNPPNGGVECKGVWKMWPAVRENCDFFAQRSRDPAQPTPH